MAYPSVLPVFLTGRNKALLLVRARASQAAGLETVVLSPETAEPLVHDLSPRVWVFCGSIEATTLVFLACTVRRHSPQSRLVLLEEIDGSGPERALFHVVLKPQAEPKAVAALAMELARSGMARSAGNGEKAENPDLPRN